MSPQWALYNATRRGSGSPQWAAPLARRPVSKTPAINPALSAWCLCSRPASRGASGSPGSAVSHMQSHRGLGEPRTGPGAGIDAAELKCRHWEPAASAPTALISLFFVCLNPVMMVTASSTELFPKFCWAVLHSLGMVCDQDGAGS